MAAIASLSLNLETNLAGWTAGLNRAGNQVDKFYAKVGDKVAGLASPATGAARQVGMLGKAIGGLASSALAPVASVAGGVKSIGASAVSAVAPIAGVAAGFAAVGVAAGVAIGAFASAGLDRIDALSDASQRLGVTTESLSELRYAANLTGSSAEDLDGALEKLSANLGDAAQKGTPAGEALAKLGLDAKQLAASGPDVAFKQIVAGFGKIPNASERASLAMDVFGKGGIKILNTLSSGGQLDELAEEAKRFGVSVSQVDAAKVGAAKDALDRAGAAVEGIGNQLAVQLAPLIEVAANQFTEWFGAAVEGAGGVEGAIGGIVSVIGFVADAGWTAQKALQEAFAGIIGAAGRALSAVGLSAGRALEDTSAAMAEDIARNFAVPPSQKLGQFLDEVKAKSAAAAAASAETAKANLGAGTSMDGLGKSIAEVTAKLKEQADTFGKTAAEADLYKLAQQGATEAQLADAKAQAERLKGLEAQKKASDDLKSFATGLVEANRTPAEKRQAEEDKIAASLSAGLLDDDTAARARKKAAAESGLDEQKFAGAAELGSTSAYTAIASALSGRGGDGMKDVAKSSSKTAMNTDRLVTLFGKVADFLVRPEPVVNF